MQEDAKPESLKKIILFFFHNDTFVMHFCFCGLSSAKCISLLDITLKLLFDFTNL